LRSVGKKLLVSIALPALIAAVLGVGFYWRRTDQALREGARAEAVASAELIAVSFRSAADDKGLSAREAHRPVTALVRSEVQSRRAMTALRILTPAGVVRWSNRIEEEDKALAGAERLLAQNTVASTQGELGPGEGKIEVLYPLGGVACAGCHTGEATLKSGVLQLVVEEPTLRSEVAQVFAGALSSVVVLILALTLATWLSLRTYLTRPLGRLAAAMKKAEEGDFLVRAPVESKDEIGELAQEFNRMLAKITALKADEVDHRRELTEAQTELKLKGELESANSKLEGRLNELSLLYDVSRAFTSTLELSEVLERITELVPTRFEVPKLSIMLVNPEGLLEVKSAQPRSAVGLTFQIGEGICGKAAETRKSVYVADLETDAMFRVRGGQGAKGRGCLLALPMVQGGELLGVLNLERPTKADFGPEEIELFGGIADQAALAVKNARLHAQTVELSITDPLTQVPNRRHLFAQLEAEIARANRFGTQLSFLMVDIDYFKKLNDSAGHRAGDQVLREVCTLMKVRVRKVDTLARYGGEEFAIILPQVTRAEALEVAEKLRRAVEEAPLEHAKVQPGGKVTISVGVASLPVDATEQDKLVDCADAALYASKRLGRNMVNAYQTGMELHPGRERGPHAQRKITGEIPVVKPASGS
jgi:diguanylate cyclase (GGDEF)-like protein